MRTPNVECHLCKKPLYIRPGKMKDISFCMPCYGISRRKPRNCCICGIDIPYDGKQNKTCSMSCYKKLLDLLLLGKKKPRENPTTAATIKKRMIEEQGHHCEWCNLTEWRNLPINLTIDHIDGNKKNNERINLRILCWNCHSQTPTYCGKNIKNPNKFA